MLKIEGGGLKLIYIICLIRFSLINSTRCITINKQHTGYPKLDKYVTFYWDFDWNFKTLLSYTGWLVSGAKPSHHTKYTLFKEIHKSFKYIIIYYFRKMSEITMKFEHIFELRGITLYTKSNHYVTHRFYTTIWKKFE